MPYNTRRKSLSLPSLGIHLPNSSRAHRLNSKSVSAIESPPQPPTKRIKRSHDENEPPSPVSSPRSKIGSPEIVEATPRSRPGPAEHTPPPSPGDVDLVSKVDTEGINDDIVIAVIEQLEKTGNRPHLIRELAAVLAATNKSVAHSANPAALLSSRLSLYLKRPWTALSPCPLAKELIPVHPRKVFFYLTTCNRQALPENSDDIISPSVNEIKRLTPSLSDPSIADDDEDADMDLQERSRMSPSPEVDLYSPEMNQNLPIGPPTPGQTFSGRSSLNPDGAVETPVRSNRAPTPPLEADEKGFTETATAVRARGMSLHETKVQASVEQPDDLPRHIEMVDESPELTGHRDGRELFGLLHPGLAVLTQKVVSSPIMPPKHDPLTTVGLTKLSLSHHSEDIEMDDDVDVEASWKMLSPESIEVDELDEMFSDF